MANTLQGKNVAILAADGVERIELEQPRDAVQQEGAHTVLLSVKSGEIQAMNPMTLGRDGQRLSEELSCRPLISPR
jgi:putative intracellular protease/amidase